MSVVPGDAAAQSSQTAKNLHAEVTGAAGRGSGAHFDIVLAVELEFYSYVLSRGSAAGNGTGSLSHPIWPRFKGKCHGIRNAGQYRPPGFKTLLWNHDLRGRPRALQGHRH